MNLKQLLFLKAAGGGGVISEPPSFFSAGGGTGKSFAKKTSNNYGTTIDSVSADANRVTVTQVYNPDYQPGSYRNGYVCVGFDSINDWLAEGASITFTADISITANPAEVSALDVFVNNASNSATITGGKINVKWTGKQPSDYYYVEIRCGGCSFVLSNCKLTKGEAA